MMEFYIKRFYQPDVKSYEPNDISWRVSSAPKNMKAAKNIRKRGWILITTAGAIGLRTIFSICSSITLAYETITSKGVVMCPN